MRLLATDAATHVVERVVAEGREGLVMVLGTGCCDSTAPFLYDRYDPGPETIEVGEVAGVRVFAHRWLADLYDDSESLQVDVDAGVPNDSFSLESEYDRRLTLRRPAPL